MAFIYPNKCFFIFFLNISVDLQFRTRIAISFHKNYFFFSETITVDTFSTLLWQMHNEYVDSYFVFWK